MSAGVMAVVSFAIVKSTTGGVCVWERTDSPATPTPKQQLPQLPAAIVSGGGWVRQGGDTWVSLMAQGLTFPLPYPCENHAPSQFSCREHSSLGSF